MLGHGCGVGYGLSVGNHRRDGGEVQKEHALSKSRGESGQLHVSLRSEGSGVSPAL